MLKSSARWRNCPSEFAAYTTVYNRFNRWSRQGLCLQMLEALAVHSGIFDGAAIDAALTKVRRSAAGAKGELLPSHRPLPREQTTKLHGLVDDHDHPRVLLLGAGYKNDISMAEALIPSIASRHVPIPFNTLAYKSRNRVGRRWCRLKDFRRIATSHDKLTRDSLSSVFIAATYACWLMSPDPRAASRWWTATGSRP